METTTNNNDTSGNNLTKLTHVKTFGSIMHNDVLLSAAKNKGIQ